MSNSKVVFITGASSGIGAATARKLVEAGHRVVLVARSPKKLNALESELGSQHALSIAADVTDFSQVEQAVEQAVKKFKRLDVVFANAGKGVATPGTEEGDPKEWSKLIDINIKGLLWTAKTTLKHLKQTKGHFIVTSSIAGRRTLKGSVYGASKWFAYGFAQNLAEEMAQWQGRCTTIAPGMVNTPFFDEPKPDKLDPNDVANAVLFSISADQRCSVREVCLMPTN